MKRKHILQILSAIHMLIQTTCALETQKFPLLMPDIFLDREEPCYCTPVKIVPDKTYYIVGFDQIAAMDVIHHMVLFGCSKPGSNNLFWDCCEEGDPCAEHLSVIYSWSVRAKDFQLLQIHYNMNLEKNQTDSSGLNVIYTEEKRSKLAGVLVLEAGGVIAPHSITHMEALCQVKEKKTIYPFAFRIHTHDLGKIVSGYRVRRDAYGEDHWTLLGKGDPQMPQMFYPAFNKGAIQYGDKIAARCTMNSTKDKYVSVGDGHGNEMCNFYLMYYVKERGVLDLKYCVSKGPPDFYWTNRENDVNNIPDEESTIFVL